MKKILCSIIFVFVLLLSSNNVEAATTIKLSTTEAILQKGDSFTLTVKGTKKKIKWSSSKKNVATVSKSGVVKAKKTGTTYITAKVGKQKIKCKVVVKSKKSIQKKIMQIYDWTCGDIWNDGFCNVKWYISDGTDNIGEPLDIEKTVADLNVALQKKDQYNKYMTTLQGKKYKKVKKIWNYLYKQMGIMQKRMNEEMPRHDENYKFPNTDKFCDYVFKFWDFTYEMK